MTTLDNDCANPETSSSLNSISSNASSIPGRLPNASPPSPLLPSAPIFPSPTVPQTSEISQAPFIKSCPTPRIHLTPRARFSNTTSHGYLATFESNSSNLADSFRSPSFDICAIPKVASRIQHSTNSLHSSDSAKKSGISGNSRGHPNDSKYRDRASERRLVEEQQLLLLKQSQDAGTNELYVDSVPFDQSSSQMLRSILTNKVIPDYQDIIDMAPGLDENLLLKRQREIEEEKRLKQLEEERIIGQQTIVAKYLVLTQDGKAKAVDAPHEFKTALGRSIYNVLFKREIPQPIDDFLPGHTTYVFNIDPQSISDVPTIVEHTIEVSHHRDIRYEPVLAFTNSEILNKMRLIMGYIKQGEKGLKLRRKDLESKTKVARDIVKQVYLKVHKQQLENQSQNSGDVDSEKNSSAQHGGLASIADDDDDIFEDVKGKVYVNPLVPDIDLSNTDQPVPTPNKEILTKIEGNANDQTTSDRSLPLSPLSLPQHIKRPKAEEYPLKHHLSSNSINVSDSTFENDEYDGFDDYGESDDENLMAMDNRVKLKRADFENEYEWEKYESSREAIPKAAFQFGVKLSDGRRVQRRGKNEKKRMYHLLQKKVLGTSKKEN